MRKKCFYALLSYNQMLSLLELTHIYIRLKLYINSDVYTLLSVFSLVQKNSVTKNSNEFQLNLVHFGIKIKIFENNITLLLRPIT